MTRRRVVITGMGTVNPLANNVRDFWNGLLEGRSGIAELSLLDPSEFRVNFGGEVKNFAPREGIDRKSWRRMDRFTQFAMVSSIEAVEDSGLDFGKLDPFRCGVIIGSGIGGLAELETAADTLAKSGPGRLSPFMVPTMMANAASGSVSIHYGLRGPNTAVSTACASAANAMTDAFRAIQYGYADVMVTGGSEAAVTPLGLGGFCAARALSTRNDDPAGASRPFDKDRDGFVLSEGAGVLVLEEYEHARARGARIYAEFLGSGCTADASHITAPHPEGLGASQAIRLALADAGVNADEVGYVNAHGTSTELGDACETLAIKAIFGDHAKTLAVSSSKSMIGHLLGASGGPEIIATVLTVKEGRIHPTINYHTPDPACDLDYVPNTARERRVRRAISNSFGFGGHNCSLLVGSLD